MVVTKIPVSQGCKKRIKFKQQRKRKEMREQDW